MVKLLFQDEELLGRNVFGGKGKEPLDPKRMTLIKNYLAVHFGPVDVQKGIVGINSHLRKYINKQQV